MKFWMCSLLLLFYSYAYTQALLSDPSRIEAKQDSLREVFMAHLNAGDSDAAIKAIRALQEVEPGSVNSMQAKIDEGVVFFQLGNAEVSLAIFRSVIDGYDEASVDWQREAQIDRAYSYIGIVYREQGRHTENVVNMLDYVGVADRLHYKYNSVGARSSLADALYNNNQLDSAIIVIEDALRIADVRDAHHSITDNFGMLSGSDSIFALDRWLDRVSLYNLRGSIEEVRFNYANAAKYYKQAVSAYTTIGTSTDDFDTQSSVLQPFINLAYNHYLNGDYYAAQKEANRIKEMLAELPKHQYYWVEDDVYYILGMMAQTRSDLDEAEAYLLQCLAAREQSEASDARYADVRVALGEVALQKEEYEKAVEYLNAVNKYPNYNSNLRAIHKQILAVAYAALGRFEEAREELLASEQLLQETNSTRGMRLLCGANSKVAAEAGDTTAAIAYLHRATAIIDEPITTTLTVEIATRLAELHVGRPDFEQYHRRALDYTKGSTGEIGSVFEDYLIPIYKAEGEHYRRVGDLPRAYTAMLRHRDQLQELRAGPRSQGSKLGLTAQARALHDELLAVCYDLYRQQPDEAYLSEAFKTIELSKAMVLLETLQDVESRRQVGVPDSLIRREQNLRSVLATLREDYEEIRIDEEASQLEMQQALLRLKNRKSEHTALLDRIAQEYPRYYQLRHDLEVDRIQDAVAHLAPNERFVSFYTDDKVLYTITVAGDGSTFHKQTLTQPLSAQVQQLRQRIDRKADFTSLG